MRVVQALEEVRLRYGLSALRECVRPMIDRRCHIPITHIPGFRTYLRLNAVDRTNPICVGKCKRPAGALLLKWRSGKATHWLERPLQLRTVFRQTAQQPC